MEAFPGGPVVKNSSANAGDTCSTPGPGIFHMPWGTWTPGATKPRCNNSYAWALEPVLCNKRSHSSEKPMQRNERVAPAHRSYRKPMPNSEDQAQPKIINKLIINIKKERESQKSTFSLGRAKSRASRQFRWIFYLKVREKESRYLHLKTDRSIKAWDCRHAADGINSLN